MYSCCAGAFEQSAWPPAAQWSAMRSYQIDNGWKIHREKNRVLLERDSTSELSTNLLKKKKKKKKANIEWTISSGMTFISVLFKGHRILNLHSDIIWAVGVQLVHLIINYPERKKTTWESERAQMQVIMFFHWKRSVSTFVILVHEQ